MYLRIHVFLWLTLLFSIANGSLYAQPPSNCGLTVYAGPDKKVCDDNPTTILEGTVSGSGLRGFEWMPPDGLSNPRLLRPTVTVTGPQCYVLTAKKKSDINLITNGNFEQGATGFSTDYIPGVTSCYGLGFLDCEGTYAVLNNPQSGHTGFAPCGDHTSGGGNMMVLNGAPGFVNIWCQTVLVKPNHDYCFSAWACSVNPGSPAQLETTINGMTVTSLSLGAATCLWEEMRADWNSGGASIATVCITNQNTSPGGNDFAIDDIVLNEICEQYDTVCVDLVEVDAVIQDPPRVCCNNPTVQLNGIGSSIGADYTYCWTASRGGRIVSGDMTLNPIIDRPGTYTLMVKGPEGCTDEAEVEVEGNLIPPRVFARAPDSLDCNNPRVRLIGGATPDENVTYEWTGPNGFYEIDQSTVAEDTGWYTLTVTDDCGCVGSAMVKVSGKANLLRIEYDADTLSCAQPGTWLTATSNQLMTSFEWLGPNGFSCDMDSCWITDPGWYYLTSSTEDGCEKLDSFEVIGDFDLPDFDVLLDTITCSDQSADFNLLAPPGSDFWWTFNQDTLSRDTFFSTLSGGDITVFVQGENGCLDSLSWEVVLDTASPKYLIQGGDIGCGDSLTTLCLLGSDAIKQWQWSGPGTNNSSDSCLEVKDEGWFHLEVIGENDCPNEDSLFIDKKETQPEPEFESPILNCWQDIDTLISKLSNAVITWTLPNGQTEQGDSLIVQDSGWYEFVITTSNTECSLTDSLFVGHDFDKPIVSISTDTITCLRDSTVVGWAGWDSIIQVQWLGPAGFDSQERDITLRQPGLYEGIFTGLNGCRDTIPFEVLQSNDYPTVSIENDTLTCDQTTITLIATPDQSGITYEWESPMGNQGTDSTFITDEEGRHILTIQNQKGCRITQEVLVTRDTVSPQFDITGLDTLTCLIQSVNLGAENVEGKINSVTWRFNNQDISADTTVRISEPGTYTLSMIGENGCLTEKTISIEQDTMSPSLTTTTDTITCSNPIAQIDLSSDLSARTYWLDAQGDSTFSNQVLISIPQLLIVGAIGQNGCVSQTTVDIPIDTVTPSVFVADDTLTCVQTEILSTVLGLADGYTWTTPDGASSSGDQLRISQGGNFTVIGLNDNGCADTATFHIEVDTTRAQLVVTGNDIDCSVDSVLIQMIADLDGQAEWFDERGRSIGTHEQFFTQKGGTYEVQFTADRNGCISQSTVTIEDLRDLPLGTWITDQPNCSHDEGRISLNGIVGGEGPYSVFIDGQDYGNGRLRLDTFPGQYVVRIEDVNGCKSLDTLTINPIIRATADLAAQATITLGDSILLMVDIQPDEGLVDQVKWSPSEGLSCDTCLISWAKPGVSTNYLVHVTDTNGCQQILEVFVKVELPKVYVPNVFTPGNGDQVNDRFFPFAEIPDQVIIDQMQIYTRWGELIFEQRDFHPNDENFGWDGLFNGERALPGVYVYSISGHFSNDVPFELAGDVTILE